MKDENGVVNISKGRVDYFIDHLPRLLSTTLEDYSL
jgi:hypothetical protein